MRNVGTPYLWNAGSSVVSADGSYPQIASIAPAAPEIKERELSRLAPGQYRRRTVDAMIGAGQRIAGLHVAGDLTLDHLLDAIEEQSAARGMTLDDIRAMRHASDHCAFNPRPDQFSRLIRLNIYMSCAPKYVLSVAPEVAEDYGPEVTKWVVPVKSMLDAGVRVVYESDVHDLDRRGMLYYLELLVTREAENGQVWNPEERIDRVTALMMATRWAAEYVLRERDLGSLEVGKWADLVVLDRDYLTVPVEDISEIRSVMTLVGGKIAYEGG
jgi:predicted amidohydrolase YtcJ